MTVQSRGKTGAYSGMIVQSRGKKRKRKIGSVNKIPDGEAIADIVIVWLIASFYKNYKRGGALYLDFK